MAISWIRLSFYLQTLFLSLLAARSSSIDDIGQSLSLLMVTNIAMVVTAIILGLGQVRLISYHDGIVVTYLLCLSWATVMLSLSSYRCFNKQEARLTKLLSVVQTLFVYGFIFTILATASTFGATPECNSHATAVIFRPFPALHQGRTLGWCIMGILTAAYALMTVVDYCALVVKVTPLQIWWKRVRKAEAAAGTSDATSRDLGLDISLDGQHENETMLFRSQNHIYKANIAYNMLVSASVICALWTLGVANIELLIHYNHFEQTDPVSPWEFGQILPIILLIIPLANVVEVYRKFGLRPLP